MAFQQDIENCDAPSVSQENETEGHPRATPSILTLEKNVQFRSLFHLPESEVLLSDLFPTQCNLDLKTSSAYGPSLSLILN